MRYRISKESYAGLNLIKLIKWSNSQHLKISKVKFSVCFFSNMSPIQNNNPITVRGKTKRPWECWVPRCGYDRTTTGGQPLHSSLAAQHWVAYQAAECLPGLSPWVSLVVFFPRLAGAWQRLTLLQECWEGHGETKMSKLSCRQSHHRAWAHSH